MGMKVENMTPYVPYYWYVEDHKCHGNWNHVFNEKAIAQLITEIKVLV